MCKSALALACLASFCLGQEAQLSTRRLERDTLAQRTNPCKGNLHNPSEALAVLSLALNPAAAFNPCGPGIHYLDRNPIRARSCWVVSKSQSSRPRDESNPSELIHRGGTSRRGVLSTALAALAALIQQPALSVIAKKELGPFDDIYYAPAWLSMMLQFEQENAAGTPSYATKVDSEFTHYECELRPYFRQNADEIVPKLPLIKGSFDVKSEWNRLGVAGRAPVEFTSTLNGLARDALNVYIVFGPLPGTTLAETPDIWFGDCLFSPYFSYFMGSILRGGTGMKNYKVKTIENIPTPPGAVGPRRKLDITVRLLGWSVEEVDKHGLASVYEVDGAAVCIYATCAARDFEKQKKYLQRVVDSFFVSRIDDESIDPFYYR